MAGYAGALVRDHADDLAIATQEVGFDRSPKVTSCGGRARPLDDEMTAAFMRERGFSTDEIMHVLGVSSPELYVGTQPEKVATEPVA